MAIKKTKKITRKSVQSLNEYYDIIHTNLDVVISNIEDYIRVKNEFEEDLSLLERTDIWKKIEQIVKLITH